MLQYLSKACQPPWGIPRHLCSARANHNGWRTFGGCIASKLVEGTKVSGFINLLPDELRRPPRKGPEEIIPVSNEALPNFGTPAHLMPDDFWSNLRQFLFEPPVKVIERPGAPFTKNTWRSGLFDNLSFFFSAPKARKGPINNPPAVHWG